MHNTFEMPEKANPLAAANKPRGSRKLAPVRWAQALREGALLAKLGAWEYRPAARTVDFSSELWALLALPERRGWPLGEALALWSESDRTIFITALEDAVRNSQRLEFEGRLNLAHAPETWLRVVGEPIFRRGKCVALRGAAQDVSEQRRARALIEASMTEANAADRVMAERRQHLMVNELNHRVKNTLAIVQGMARQTFRGGEVPQRAVSIFEERLIALSSAHNLLAQHSWEAASLDEIVRSAIGGVCDQPTRLDAAGPAIDLEPNAAVALSLALHELGANALKHGALSVPEGRIEIRWGVTAQTLTFSWREFHGPAVQVPTHRGFGSRLLERGLSQDLGGKVELCFEPSGLVCNLVAPLGGAVHGPQTVGASVVDGRSSRPITSAEAIYSIRH